MANRRRGPITNRRHLARQERERLQVRAITIVSVVILAIVLVLVVYGLIVSRFIEPTQPVASVNGQEILTREFRSRVYYERLLVVNQWNQLADLMISFGGSDPNSAAFFVNQMNQLEFQLDPTTIGRSVLNQLIADRLIRQEVEARGIVVTEEEVDRAVEEFFSYYGGGVPPTATATPTAAPTSTLTSLQMTLTAPTATPTLVITDTQSLTDTVDLTPTQAVDETGTVTTTAEITSTAVVSPEIEVTPIVTITSTPRPTATPISQESFQATYTDYLDLLGGYGITDEDLRYLIESQLYREKLFEVLTADVQPVQDQVWARHILVASEAEALDAVARLNAGEEFAALAAELSTDTASAANGGDLGWFGIGQMVLEFEKVAFNLAIGAVSAPVQSQFGWHVIQVLGHEMRHLTADEYAQLRQTEFEEWVSRQRLQADVQIFDLWADRVPTSPGVPAGGAQALLQQLQLQQPQNPQP